MSKLPPLKYALPLLLFCVADTLPAQQAGETKQPGDFKYTSDGSAITITGYIGKGGAVTIPEAIEELPVTAIGNRAFKGHTSLDRVTIPHGVIKIGYEAFESCKNLATVNIPASVASFAGGVFGNCTNLATVTIPPNVTSIGGNIFYGCTSLLTIDVEEANPKYRSMDGVLFDKGLTNMLIFPPGKSGDYTIPASVKRIGAGGFDFCPGLINIEVAVGNLKFSSINGVLFDIDKTVLIRYPGGKLGSYAIPDSVNKIRSYAFIGCIGLTRVMIPENLANIESGQFRHCTSLASIEVAEGNPNFHSVDGVLFDADRTRLIQYPGGKIGNYAIPDGATQINMAFTGCRGLTSVVIPASPRRGGIVFYTFEHCTNLTSILIKGRNPFMWKDGHEGEAFENVAPGFTIYISPGTTGFTMPTWMGHPVKEGEPPAETQLAAPLTWTSKDNKTIKANFVKLDGEAVVVRMEDGMEHKIPFTRLSPESAAQAKALAQAAAGK